MLLKGSRVASQRLSRHYVPSPRIRSNQRNTIYSALCHSFYVRMMLIFLLAVTLIALTAYLFFEDNKEHSHFGSFSSSSSSASDLITSEELEFLNHTNTARTRNQIPSAILRPLIQNTKDDVHIVRISLYPLTFPIFPIQ